MSASNLESSYAVPRTRSRRTSWKDLRGGISVIVEFFEHRQASLAEVGYCIHVAQRLGYVSTQVSADLEMEVRTVGAPLAGLIRSSRAHVAVKTVAWIVMCIGTVIAASGG